MRILEINLLVLFFTISLKNIESKMNFDQLLKAGRAVGKSCQRQSGCPIELINNARLNGDFPPVPELMCYFKCLFQAMKVIKDDNISEEAMHVQMGIMLNEDLAKSLDGMAAHCIPQINSPDVCEQAYQFTVCSYNYNVSLYFFP